MAVIVSFIKKTFSKLCARDDGPSMPNAYVFKATMMASMNSVLVGFSIGVMGGAGIYMQREFGLNSCHIEVLMALLGAIAIVGALNAGWISDRFGRTKTLGFGAVVFLVGNLLMACAVNYPMIVIGRAITGLGVGFGFALDPVYISELSPKRFRGFLTTFSELGINVGVLLGFMSNWLFALMDKDLSELDPTANATNATEAFCKPTVVHAPDSCLDPYKPTSEHFIGWRFMIGVGVLPSACMFVFAFWCMPETPRWLVMKERVEEAKKVIELCNKNTKTRLTPGVGKVSEENEENTPREEGDNDENQFENMDEDPVAATVANIQESLANERKESNPECFGWGNIFKPTPVVRHTLLIGLMVAVMQQASGIETAMYYQPQILRHAGFRESKTQLFIAFATGIAKLVAVFLAGFTVDHLAGRRSLLLASYAGCMLSLLMMAVGYTVCAPALNVTGLFFYLISFSIGLGPVTWLYVSEIFSLEVRARAMSLVTAAHRFTGFICSMTFLSFAEAVGPAGVFYFYAFVSFVSLALTYIFVPEVKGLSLEDVGDIFQTIVDRKTCVPCLRMAKHSLLDGEGPASPEGKSEDHDDVVYDNPTGDEVETRL